MSKEEIINDMCVKWFNEDITLKPAFIHIWNAAIEAAAKEVYKSDNANVVKQYIKDLKFPQ